MPGKAADRLRRSRMDDLTDQVVASFAGSADPRFSEVMTALVRHLHAFAREVGLTEQEYFAGIDFLTRTGQSSGATRQEFVLLADVLGLSMLTVGLGDRTPPGATEPTVRAGRYDPRTSTSWSPRPAISG